MDDGHQTDRKPPRLRAITRDALTASQTQVYDSILGSRTVMTDHRGALPGPFNAMLYSPEVGGALQALGAAIRSTTSIPGRAREIATLTVAAHLGCEYEWSRHEPLGRQHGLTDQDIDMLRRGGSPEFPDPRERYALAVTRSLLTASDLTDDEYAEAVAHLGEPGLVTVSTLVGYYCLLATQLRLFRVEPPDGRFSLNPQPEPAPGSVS